MGDVPIARSVSPQDKTIPGKSREYIRAPKAIRNLDHRDRLAGIVCVYNQTAVMNCNNLYSSSNIIGVMKSRKMRWAEHVAGMRLMRNVYNILVRNQKEMDKLGDIGVGGKVIVICVLLK
jgi:hypothetical protein